GIARRYLGVSVRGTVEGFSLAGAGSQARRADAAAEKANSFLVDDVDLLSNTLITAAFANSEKGWPFGSDPPLYQREHRRSEGSDPQSSQHCRKCLPVSRPARSQEE